MGGPWALSPWALYMRVPWDLYTGVPWPYLSFGARLEGLLEGSNQQKKQLEVPQSLQQSQNWHNAQQHVLRCCKGPSIHQTKSECNRAQSGEMGEICSIRSCTTMGIMGRHVECWKSRQDVKQFRPPRHPKRPTRFLSKEPAPCQSEQAHAFPLESPAHLHQVTVRANLASSSIYSSKNA